jgi:hypothetical protein
VNLRLRQLFKEFGGALGEALASSPDAAGALRRLRAEGFSLYLVADRGSREPKPGNGEQEALATVAAARAEERPDFRINVSDLFFLRSIGIDPTRRPKSGS